MRNLSAVQQQQLKRQLAAFYLTRVGLTILLGAVIAASPLFLQGTFLVEIVAQFGIIGNAVLVCLGIVLIVVGVLQMQIGLAWVNRIESIISTKVPRDVDLKITPPDPARPYSCWTALLSEPKAKRELFFPSAEIKTDEISNKQVRLPVYFDSDDSPIAISTESGLIFFQPP